MACSGADSCETVLHRQPPWSAATDEGHFYAGNRRGTLDEIRSGAKSCGYKKILEGSALGGNF